MSSDVLQFLVFLQHFLLLSCHCRFVLEHQSSNLDNVIEFPSSYTLLESKRNTQLLRLIMQQAFAKHDMCLNKCLPLLTITPVVLFLPSKSLAQSESTCTCNVSSDVCRASVNTHLLFFTRYRPNPFEFLHVSTPRLFHVSRKALHYFSNVNSVLSNIRQLHHHTAMQCRLR